MSHITNKDIEYRPFVLSDEKVVELLISFRYKYDENMFLENDSMFYVTGVKPLNQELVNTYVSLDETIKKCNFSEQQLKLIKMIEQSYTYREIEKTLNIQIPNIKKMLNTIYKTIVETNLREWRKVVYTNILDLKTKQCSKCKEILPATNEFFTNKNDAKDGFHPYCKKCKK